MSRTIAFIIADLNAGGAQRVAVALMNGWAARGYRVHVMTFDAPQTSFFPLDDRITIHPLDMMNESSNVLSSLFDNIARLARLRRAVKNANPDSVVSFVVETNIMAILATLGLKSRMIVSERADPHYYPRGRVWRLLRALVYPFANRIVCQTSHAARFFGNGPKTAVIPNPVIPRGLDGADGPRFDHPYAVAVGRFDPVKNYPDLVRCFAGVDSGLDLVLVGDGPDRAFVEEAIDEARLDRRVHVTGSLPNPEPIVAGARMMILSSLSEGLPNAVIEAMAMGIPCVVTECSPAMREIITDGETGLIVPVNDDVAMAAAINRLNRDEALRTRLGQQAKESASRYDPGAVLDAWDRVLAF